MSGAAEHRYEGSLDVPEDERPDAEVIAARIDLGSAEYHEHCCPWLMWSADSSAFSAMPNCECGGPAMAEWYVEFARALKRIADGDYPEGFSAGAFADAVLREQRP